MQEYVVQLSKYFIVICMAAYAFEGFAVFRFQSEEARKGIYLRQNILMFFIQFAAFLTIVLKTSDYTYLLFYAIIQILLFGIILITDMLYPKANRLLVNHMCMLLGIGFIVLTRLSIQKTIRQFVIVVCSMVIAMCLPSILDKWRFLKNFKWIYAVVGIAGLSAVLIYGQVVHGSNISFSILGVTFQPSEFVKLIFVFYVAASLAEDSGFWNVVTTTLFAGLHVVILVVSRDLGSALIFFIAYLFILFMATKNYIYLLLGFVGGAGASVVAYRYFSHIRVRVQAWLDPWTYIDNQGYQVTQSLFGVGSGSWFGMGILSGNPEAIPYVEKDSIFSAICEEMGVVFGILLILICLSCFVMMMDIALKIREKFFQNIAFGLGVMYIFQVFLTIGGGIKFIPLTGVTLPLVSYGGSSVLSTLLLFYVIEGLYIIQRKEEQNGKKRRRVQRRQVYEETEPEPEYPAEDLVFLDGETDYYR